MSTYNDLKASFDHLQKRCLQLFKASKLREHRLKTAVVNAWHQFNDIINVNDIHEIHNRATVASKFMKSVLEKESGAKMFTINDYKNATSLLESGMTQLQPDGNCCAICGDNDHQAWECYHNPLHIARRVEKAENRWRCFHCNEVFNDPEQARKHFGNIPTATPRCILDKCLCLECQCNPLECRGKE